MSKYLSLMLTYLILIISFTSHYIQLFFPLSSFFFIIIEFIPCMDKLFDESILIGSGYTARETLRYDGQFGTAIECMSGLVAFKV